MGENEAGVLLILPLDNDDVKNVTVKFSDVGVFSPSTSLQYVSIYQGRMQNMNRDVLVRIRTWRGDMW